MTSKGAARVQRHRMHLREKGLRPIQIWVPDTHRAGFAEECKKQSRIAAASEHEVEILDFISNAADRGEWH